MNRGMERFTETIYTHTIAVKPGWDTAYKALTEYCAELEEVKSILLELARIRYPDDYEGYEKLKKEFAWKFDGTMTIPDWVKIATQETHTNG
jgi:hypothetical protein